MEKEHLFDLQGQIISTLIDIQGEDDLRDRFIDQLRVLVGLLLGNKNAFEVQQMNRNLPALKLIFMYSVCYYNVIVLAVLMKIVTVTSSTFLHYFNYFIITTRISTILLGNYFPTSYF